MRGITLLLLGTALGCGGASAEVGDTADTQTGEGAGATAPQGTEGWPSHLLAGEGAGPALYLHAEADSPAIGYVSPGVRMRIASGPSAERLPVWVDGPLKVRGWVPFQRLAGRAQERGRVEGTPAYLGPNDVVGVRGLAGPDTMRVEVQPWLGRGAEPTLPTFPGTFPAGALAADEVDPNAVEGPTPGTPMQLPAGQEVAVYDRPDASQQPVATLPALDPPLVVVVLRDSDEWRGVRAGVGPYLVGYVNAPLEPTDREPEVVGGVIGQAASTGGIPQRLAAEADRPLWRVPAGTHVKFDGTTIAQLNEDGWAREMNRYENEVDVFVAVNDDVAIRGMVRPDALQAVEGQPQQQPAQQPPATQPPATQPPAQQPPVQQPPAQQPQEGSGGGLVSPQAPPPPPPPGD